MRLCMAHNKMLASSHPFHARMRVSILLASLLLLTGMNEGYALLKFSNGGSASLWLGH